MKLKFHTLISYLPPFSELPSTLFQSYNFLFPALKILFGCLGNFRVFCRANCRASFLSIRFQNTGELYGHKQFDPTFRVLISSFLLSTMELAFAPLSYSPISKKLTFQTKPYTSAPNDTRKVSKRLVQSFPSTISSSTPTETLGFELENKKHDLLRAVQETKRGLNTTPDQRSSIEEALVTVEGYDAGQPIDLDKLDGTWRLQYTSAPDVVVLFEASERFPFLEVGQIFQKFECKNQADKGVVRNVIRWSIRSLLEEQEGATLLVSAKFSVVSRRNIYLEFEEITLQDIKISEVLQAIIAPAILPRSFLSLRILQFIRAFKAEVPVTSTGTERRSVGGLYYLSYLDNNMLLGRAVGGGGVFVFTRAQPLIF